MFRNKLIAVVVLSQLMLCPLQGYALERPQTLHLSLPQALQKSWAISVGVLVANARVEQAMARLSDARSSLLPHVEGIVSGGRKTVDLRSSGIQFPGPGPHIGPFNTFDARGRITQTLFDAGAFERLRAARLGENLSASQLFKARQDALALVAAMYIQAMRAQHHVHAVHAFLKRDHKALLLAIVKKRQGTGSILALKKSRSDYTQSKYLYRAALVDAKEKRLDLSAALNIPVDQSIVFDRIRPSTIIKGISVINPDVIVAKDQVNQIQAEAKAAQADYLPKVIAVGDYGRAGTSPSNGSNTYALGVQATIPLWEGGAKQAAVNESKARLKESQDVLDDAKRQSEVRILEARQNIVKAKDLMRAKESELDVAIEQMNTALEHLKSGTGNALDFDKALAEKIMVEDEQDEAKAALFMAKVSLTHVLGQMETLMQE